MAASQEGKGHDYAQDRDHSRTVRAKIATASPGTLPCKDGAASRGECLVEWMSRSLRMHHVRWVSGELDRWPPRRRESNINDGAGQRVSQASASTCNHRRAVADVASRTPRPSAYLSLPDHLCGGPSGVELDGTQRTHWQTFQTTDDLHVLFSGRCRGSGNSTRSQRSSTTPGRTHLARARRGRCCVRTHRR